MSLKENGRLLFSNENIEIPKVLFQRQNISLTMSFRIFYLYVYQKS